MKFLGKMSLMTILKDTKNQGFTPSLLKTLGVTLTPRPSLFRVNAKPTPNIKKLKASFI